MSPITHSNATLDPATGSGADILHAIEVSDIPVMQTAMVSPDVLEVLQATGGGSVRLQLHRSNAGRKTPATPNTTADLNAKADAALFLRLGAERYTAAKQQQQLHAAVAQFKDHLSRARHARQVKTITVAEFEAIEQRITGYLDRIHGRRVPVKPDEVEQVAA